MELPVVDEKIKILTPLERRLVSLRIPFMKIYQVQPGQQFAIHGGVANVVTDVMEMFKKIPINPNNTGIIHLKLKRKQNYTSHYLFERIRPKAVFEAAQVLANSELYKDLGIIFDQTWLDENQHMVSLNTDSTEGI